MDPKCRRTRRRHLRRSCPCTSCSVTTRARPTPVRFPVSHAEAKRKQWRRRASPMRFASRFGSTRPSTTKSARSGSSCGGQPTPSTSATGPRPEAWMTSSRCCATPRTYRRRALHPARLRALRRRQILIPYHRRSASFSTATTPANFCALHCECGSRSCALSGTRSSVHATAATRVLRLPPRLRPACCSRASTSHWHRMAAPMRAFPSK